MFSPIFAFLQELNHRNFFPLLSFYEKLPTNVEKGAGTCCTAKYLRDMVEGR